MPSHYYGDTSYTPPSPSPSAPSGGGRAPIRSYTSPGGYTLTEDDIFTAMMAGLPISAEDVESLGMEDQLIAEGWERVGIFWKKKPGLRGTDLPQDYRGAQTSPGYTPSPELEQAGLDWSGGQVFGSGGSGAVTGEQLKVLLADMERAKAAEQQQKSREQEQFVLGAKAPSPQGPQGQDTEFITRGGKQTKLVDERYTIENGKRRRTTPLEQAAAELQNAEYRLEQAIENNQTYMINKGKKNVAAARKKYDAQLQSTVGADPTEMRLQDQARFNQWAKLVDQDLARGRLDVSTRKLELDELARTAKSESAKQKLTSASSWINNNPDASDYMKAALMTAAVKDATDPDIPFDAILQMTEANEAKRVAEEEADAAKEEKEARLAREQKALDRDASLILSEFNRGQGSIDKARAALDKANVLIAGLKAEKAQAEEVGESTVNIDIALSGAIDSQASLSQILSQRESIAPSKPDFQSLYGAGKPSQAPGDSALTPPAETEDWIEWNAPDGTIRRVPRSAVPR